MTPHAPLVHDGMRTAPWPVPSRRPRTGRSISASRWSVSAKATTFPSPTLDCRRDTLRPPDLQNASLRHAGREYGLQVTPVEGRDEGKRTVGGLGPVVSCKLPPRRRGVATCGSCNGKWVRRQRTGTGFLGMVEGRPGGGRRRTLRAGRPVLGQRQSRVFIDLARRAASCRSVVPVFR